jgi:hypothetical protein
MTTFDRSRLATKAPAVGRRDRRTTTDARCPEFCSADFLSGAGWAWRVTAVLARSRRTDASRPRRRSAAGRDC